MDLPLLRKRFFLRIAESAIFATKTRKHKNPPKIHYWQSKTRVMECNFGRLNTGGVDFISSLPFFRVSFWVFEQPQ